jgi:hypothetical protein
MRTCERCGAKIGLLINGQPMCLSCEVMLKRKLKIVPKKNATRPSSQIEVAGAKRIGMQARSCLKLNDT